MPGHLTVSVTDFGPIREGAVELRPLTVFIGPNNTGKSYLALLTYALCRRLTSGLLVWSADALDWPEEAEHALEQWLSQVSPSGLRRGRRAGAAPELPEVLKQALQQSLAQLPQLLGGAMNDALRDYFGATQVSELSRSGPAVAGHPSISLDSGQAAEPFLQFVLTEGGATAAYSPPATLPTAAEPLAAALGEAGEALFRLRSLGLSRAFSRAWWLAILRAEHFPSGAAYYLPSARSGILQAWHTFLSMAVEIVRGRMGLEPVEVPALTGVNADFLQMLLQLQEPFGPQRGRRDLEEVVGLGPALELLETQILRGRVSLVRQRLERISLRYESTALQLPLQRASSMVAELAPLDLLIKYQLKPGDLVILDEPEAHLHPENQARMATLLVKLVKAGVQVLCPTHSSLILHQLSNHIMAARAGPNGLERAGLTRDDALAPDELGVYLFEPSEEGVLIRPVPTDPEVGISEDEFVRVAEAIGDQTYFLSAAMPEPAGR